MGAVASFVQPIVHRHLLVMLPHSMMKPKATKSIQDDARSFYSKASAIKLLIRGEDSRRAFRNFLETNSAHMADVAYLDYYLMLDSIKICGGTDSSKRQKYLDVIEQWERKKEAAKECVAIQAIVSTMQSWKSTDELTDSELCELMGRSQEDILGILTPNFEQFVASKQYLQWNKQQTSLEKRQSAHTVMGDDAKSSRRAPGAGADAANKKPLPVFHKRDKKAEGASNVSNVSNVDIVHPVPTN
jgi:hypothetical protein